MPTPKSTVMAYIVYLSLVVCAHGACGLTLFCTRYKTSNTTFLHQAKMFGKQNLLKTLHAAGRSVYQERVAQTNDIAFI